MRNSQSTLYLLPNFLGDIKEQEEFFPPAVKRAIFTLDGLVAESEKEARRYLIQFLPREPANKLPVLLLNEHTTDAEIKDDILPNLQDQTWGIISDCGLPCLADPGAKLIFLANEKNFLVKPFAGPSSLLFALMLSGFPAQKFSFHGYLPRKEQFLQQKVFSLEKEARNHNSTQMWIEAPYRSQKMLDFLLSVLRKDTLLCVAANLTMKNQFVRTQKVSAWKKMTTDLKKTPCVFLLYSKASATES